MRRRAVMIISICAALTFSSCALYPEQLPEATVYDRGFEPPSGEADVTASPDETGSEAEEPEAHTSENGDPEVIIIDPNIHRETTKSGEEETTGQEPQKTALITASHPSGYYDESFTLKLECEGEYADAKIYYTLDGDDPDEEAFLYTDGIAIMKTGDVKLYPVRAVAIAGERASRVLDLTYVLCDAGSFARELDIVSLTSDSEGLYDYYRGIMVPGYIHDKNVEEGNTEGFIRGNYSMEGDEWVRPAHITMLGDGEVFVDQNVGIAIAGNTSALHNTKSFNVSAGKEYDEENTHITFERYDYRNETAPYSFVTNYKKLRLRSGSQDMPTGNIRSAVISRLCEAMGFYGCTATHRALVFLNGEFYGIFDIQQNYTDRFLSRRFGLPDKEKVYRLKSGEDEIIDSTLGIRKLFVKDLDDPANREAVEAIVDMDDMMRYYALNIFCNNTDWPQNNYQMWKYEGEYVPGNPYTDGRWRFLEFDTDITFQSEDSPEMFPGSRGDMFEFMLTDGMFRCMSMFDEVISSDYYRNYFLCMMCDYFGTAFSQESLRSIIEGERSLIERAEKSTAHPTVYETWEKESAAVLTQALKRQDELEALFEEYLGVDCSDVYTVNVKGTRGCVIRVNHTISVFPGQEYSATYYRGTRALIEVLPSPGYSVQGVNAGAVFLAGGENYVSPEVCGTDPVKVEAVLSREENALVIDAVYLYGHGDYVDIYNAGTQEAVLSDCYLSDDPELRLKSRLPQTTLAPGQTLRLYGKDNEEAGPHISFNISKNETIYLTGPKLAQLDMVYAGDIEENECLKRLEHSAVWNYATQQ